MSYLRGERYKLEKQAHGGDRGNQHTKESSAKNEHLAKTADRLSSQYRVSPATIRNDASYAADTC